MNKNKKLKNLDQLDGKFVEENSFKSLDALLGEDSSSPYKSKNESEYESFLSELGTTDLHRHAEKVGLVPSVEKRVLKDRLMREFRRFVASRSFVSSDLSDQHSFQDSYGENLSNVARKILREGT